MLRPDRRARHHLDVRRDDDVRAFAQSSALGRRRPVVAAQPHVGRRPDPESPDPYVPGTGTGLLPGLRAHRDGARRDVPGSGGEHQQGGHGRGSVFFANVRLVRPDLTDAGPGERGEVLIQGPNVTPGYWNDPEATAAAFSEGGWFHSGRHRHARRGRSRLHRRPGQGHVHLGRRERLSGRGRSRSLRPSRGSGMRCGRRAAREVGPGGPAFVTAPRGPPRPTSWARSSPAWRSTRSRYTSTRSRRCPVRARARSRNRGCANSPAARRLELVSFGVGSGSCGCGDRGALGAG